MDALRANVICSLLHVLNYFKTSKRYDFPPSKRQFFSRSSSIFRWNWVFFSFSVRIEFFFLFYFFFHFLFKLSLRYLLMNKIREFIDFKINGRFFYVATHHKWYHWKWQDIIELNDWLHDSLQITRKLLTEQDCFFLVLIEIEIKCTSDHYTMAH